MLRSLRCCLNPKVIGGLVAAGLLLWLLAPGSGAAALPALVALICPLSMGVMMWQMRGGKGGASCAADKASKAVPLDEDADVAALNEELAVARARRTLAGGGGDRPPA